jgi:hypothetical protein
MGASSLFSAPTKTGEELGMKESYDEGLANYIGPESSGDNGYIIGEASIGESADWILSPVRDINPYQGSNQAILSIFKQYRPRNRCFEGLKGHFRSKIAPVRNSREKIGFRTSFFTPIIYFVKNEQAVAEIPFRLVCGSPLYACPVAMKGYHLQYCLYITRAKSAPKDVFKKRIRMNLVSVNIH